MDQKNCKFGSYYAGLVKKSGLMVPAFGALAMFAILFYVRFVGMFDKLNTVSPVAYWLVIIGSIIACGLIVAYIVMGIKNKDIGARDTLLLTLDFLMLFLLVGTIIFNFVCIETVYYAVALIVVCALSFFRVKFAEVKCCCGCDKKKVRASNTTVSKYFSLVMERFGFWKLFLAAFTALGALLVSRAWGFPDLFLSEVSYTIGLLLVAAIAFAAFVISMIGRISGKEVNGVDAFVVFALFATVLSFLMLIGDYTVTKLALTIVALVIIYAFVLILAGNTYAGEEETDAAFFATDANKEFVKGPKVYFRQFAKSFNMYVLGAIALVMFAIFSALAATNLFGWASDNGFMLYLVIGLLIFLFLGLVYLGNNLKKAKIGFYDAILAVFDVSLLLLAITIFTNLGDNMTATLVVWIIEMIVLVAFTVTRLFMVKEVVEKTIDETAAKEAAIEEVKVEEEVKAE